jgi:ABC-type nitrate/sulfonate/bicarbonate transport system substrate-binding protein
MVNFAMIKLLRVVLGLLAVEVLVVAFCAPSQAASGPRNFVIGHAAMNARVAPLWVGEDHGFFAKQGVSVNAIFIRIEGRETSMPLTPAMTLMMRR